MKILLKLFVSSIVLVLLNVTTVYADNTGVMQLKSFLKNSINFEATFSQSLFDENGIELQFSAGKFSLQKPGKFSWDYDEPYHQIIMSNGKLIWMFDSELEQVIIKPVDSSLSKTSMVLLFNETDIDKDFKVLKLDVVHGVNWLELTAIDQDSEFNSILIGMKDNLIASIKLIDGFGQTTVIKFTDISTSHEFKKNRFEFVIPKNVDVIGGE
ncbi:MAG: outer membrane lipoprotein chaperone LolA [Gammaproteobacteria bacterium]|nr:outer membrane lipoprotein chaperone LolA [Gammaproteobacteria bacterium]